MLKQPFNSHKGMDKKAKDIEWIHKINSVSSKEAGINKNRVSETNRK